jgi:hypothetical protein
MQQIMAHLNVEIVKRPDQAKGFVVLPKRWVVERTFAWLNRCRRLAKDWECLNRKARAFLLLASVRLMLRRLIRQEQGMIPDRLSDICASSLYRVGRNLFPSPLGSFSVRLSAVSPSRPDSAPTRAAMAVKDGRRPSRSGAKRP